MIILIDNYDSFAFNLVRFLEELGEEVRVHRNDAVDVDAVRAAGPSHIILSPGPCTPREAGCSIELVRELGAQIPILGVCLGHQSIAEALGGAVGRARAPMHGRVSAVTHDGGGLFAGLPSPLDVVRYHSLVVDAGRPGEGIRVTAESDGEVMALEHESRPLWGVQFHPEAVLTFGGHRLLANFLALGRGEDPAEVDLPAAPCGEIRTPSSSPTALRRR